MAKEFRATRYSKCSHCTNPIRPGQPVRVDFTSRETMHAWCVGEIASLAHREDSAYSERVDGFREDVRSVRCPKCSAPAKAKCRDLGVERDSVHRARVNAWRRRAVPPG